VTDFENPSASLPSFACSATVDTSDLGLYVASVLDVPIVILFLFAQRYFSKARPGRGRS
jgi:ABC-type maltose transport system permease subunit